MQALGIADGAVLIPRAPGVADLIRDAVLPVLDTMAPLTGAARTGMTVTADAYRAALRRHPAGVVIVTLMSDAGPVGFTATSFASLSLDPPLVCFNITHTSSSIAALREAALDRRSPAQ